jgi:hypothetical protein
MVLTSCTGSRSKGALSGERELLVPLHGSVRFTVVLAASDLADGGANCGMEVGALHLIPPNQTSYVQLSIPPTNGISSVFTTTTEIASPVECAPPSISITINPRATVSDSGTRQGAGKPNRGAYYLGGSSLKNTDEPGYPQCPQVGAYHFNLSGWTTDYKIEMAGTGGGPAGYPVVCSSFIEGPVSPSNRFS